MSEDEMKRLVRDVAMHVGGDRWDDYPGLRGMFDSEAEKHIDAINASGTHRIVSAAEIERRDKVISNCYDQNGKVIPDWVKIEVVELERRILETKTLKDRLSGVDAGTHQIVPKEPTEAMKAAGLAASFQYYTSAIYRAMIAAAPAEGDKE